MTGFDTQILGNDRGKFEEKYHIHFYTNDARNYKVVEEICRLFVDSSNEMTKEE